MDFDVRLILLVMGMSVHLAERESRWQDCNCCKLRVFGGMLNLCLLEQEWRLWDHHAAVCHHHGAAACKTHFSVWVSPSPHCSSSSSSVWWWWPLWLLPPTIIQTSFLWLWLQEVCGLKNNSLWDVCQSSIMVKATHGSHHKGWSFFSAAPPHFQQMRAADKKKVVLLRWRRRNHHQQEEERK